MAASATATTEQNTLSQQAVANAPGGPITSRLPAMWISCEQGVGQREAHLNATASYLYAGMAVQPQACSNTASRL